jgi:hypothetical protein
MDQTDNVTCPNCQAPNPDGATMCQSCGWHIDQVTTWPPPPPPNVVPEIRKSAHDASGLIAFAFIFGFAATLFLSLLSAKIMEDNHGPYGPPLLGPVANLLLGLSIFLLLPKQAKAPKWSFLAGVVSGAIIAIMIVANA